MKSGQFQKTRLVKLIAAVPLIVFAMTIAPHISRAQFLAGPACVGLEVAFDVGNSCSRGTVYSPYSWEFTPVPQTIRWEETYDGNGIRTYNIAYATWNSTGSVGLAVYNIYCDGQWSNGNFQSFEVGSSITPTLSFSLPYGNQVCQGGPITVSSSTNVTGVVNYYIDNTFVFSGPAGTHQVSTGGFQPGAHAIHAVLTSYQQCSTITTVVSSDQSLYLTGTENLSVGFTTSGSTVCESFTSFQIKAEVASQGNLGFAWYINDSQLVDGFNHPINTQTITINPQSYYSGSVITVYVSSDFSCGGGTVSANYTLIKTANPVPPNVTMQPVTPAICPGDPVTFVVTSGYPSGSVLQWKLDNVVVGNNQPTLTLPTGSNASGYFTSLSNVQVTVTPPIPPSGCPYPYVTGASFFGSNLTFNALPDPPNGTLTYHRCGAGSLLLTPGVGYNGNSLKWYLPGGGTQITTAGLPIDIVATTTYQVASYNSATGCEGAKVTVTAQVDSPPGQPSPTGANSHFGAGSVTLTANPDTYGHVVHWYGLGPSVLSGSTQQTPFISATTTYYITSYDPVTGCESGQVPIVAVIIPAGANWIKNYTVMVGGVTDSTVVGNLPVGQMNKTTTYFDGLGRPIQTVVKQNSPDSSDLVMPVVYDEFGREVTKYLPYVSSEKTGGYKGITVDNNGSYSASPQYLFYNNGLSDMVEDDQFPFSKTVFEPSPLNRVLRMGAAGSAWQPDPNLAEDHTIVKDYKINDDQRKVYLFNYNSTTGLISLSSDQSQRWYDPNQLIANITIDENNGESIEFVDKTGHVICKKVQYKTDGNNVKQYAETYYVYDDFGNLVMVLPPEGVKAVVATQP